jgi:hypothetical protein
MKNLLLRFDGDAEREAFQTLMFNIAHQMCDPHDERPENSRRKVQGRWLKRIIAAAHPIEDSPVPEHPSGP